VTHFKPFIQQLIELRNTLFRSAISFVVIFVCLSFYANDIYTFFSAPLIAKLTDGNKLVSTGLTSTFLVPIKITAFISFLLSLPFIFYQFWRFITPGLYKKEKKLVLLSFISGFILFFIGMSFAYYLIFPIVFNFFILMTPSNVSLMIDISSYLDLILSLLISFGLAFEVPVIILILVTLGWVKVKNLEEMRPYMIVIAFIIGAILTPPDVISQFCLAIPLWFLYELGLLVSKQINLEA
jgi:sec-independent protein translocase protein TatC